MNEVLFKQFSVLVLKKTTVVHERVRFCYRITRDMGYMYQSDISMFEPCETSFFISEFVRLVQY
jgi:hypothetical protein